ncbi:hypothetical protein TrST_g815 [Triparma strigata]|uniref:Micro-fibrillar-associated protein 1 C-terminal domain-containing protein n=1 Tax=Triparma strigata TaxID=1606541 RepID=A0A9W7BEE6_9STRA|nr:hypothetical protein TrST_g815 [Triparma strigata]
MSRENFGKGDLDKLLSSTAGENLQATHDATEMVFNDGDDGVQIRGRAKDKVVVKRWRRGEGEESDSDDESDDGLANKEKKKEKAPAKTDAASSVPQPSRPSARPPRRSRSSSSSSSDSDSDGPRRKTKPRVRARVKASLKSTAPKVAGDSSDSDSSSDGEEEKRRRERIRNKAKEREEEEKAKLKINAEQTEQQQAEEDSKDPSGSSSSEEEEKSGSESEEESSDDGRPPTLSLKFVPKSQRGKTAWEKEEEKSSIAAVASASQKKARKAETRALAASILQKEKELNGKEDVSNDQADLAGLPSCDSEDDDFPDPTSRGYKDWEEREILRLVEESLTKSRKKDDIKLLEKKKELSKMTDEERILSDPTLMEKVSEQKQSKINNKSKGNLLQRYQHKGAFYMDPSKLDATDVRNRNYHLQATDSAVDVSKLPEVMRRKGFGIKGMSKYKGAKEEDTTGDFRVMEDKKRKRR